MSEAEGWEYVAYRDVAQVARPIITVDFWFADGSSVHPMLIDTGADNIVLPARLMQPWGIEREACDLVQGNTFFGVADGFRYPSVRIELADLWAGRSFTAPIVFSPRLDGFLYGLLGREPFLDHFQCRFGHGDGYGLCLKPY